MSEILIAVPVLDVQEDFVESSPDPQPDQSSDQPSGQANEHEGGKSADQSEEQPSNGTSDNRSSEPASDNQQTPKRPKQERKPAAAAEATPVSLDRSKRERKSVTPYNAAKDTPTKSASVGIEAGAGITLGEYAFFTASLEKLKGDDDIVKSLHSLLFNSVGKKLETKKHLRAFSGFPKGQSTDDKRTKLLENKKKWTVSLLKDCLGLFGLEKSGSREELVDRLIGYLAEPEELKKSGSASAGKRKRASSGGKKTAKKAKGPKKSPSAFILFGQSVREDIKKKNPDASFGDIGKLIGQAWNDAKESVKEKWRSKAAELKGNSGEDATNGDDSDDVFDDEDDEDEEDEGDAEEEDEDFQVREEDAVGEEGGDDDDGNDAKGEGKDDEEV
jgi:hypothetical protein